MFHEFCSQKSCKLMVLPLDFWQHSRIVKSLFFWPRIVTELQMKILVHFCVCNHFTYKFYCDLNLMLSLDFTGFC